MNKSDLIEPISTGAGITKVQANQALDTLVEGITGALKKGDRVTLVGFGTFSTSNRKARTGRNPRSGQPLKIAARRVAKFTTGPRLQAAINRRTPAVQDPFLDILLELSEYH